MISVSRILLKDPVRLRSPEGGFRKGANGKGRALKHQDLRMVRSAGQLDSWK